MATTSVRATSRAHASVRVALPRAIARGLERAPLPPLVVVGAHVTGLTLARAVAIHEVPVIAVDEARRGPASHSDAAMFLRCETFYGEGFIRFLEDLATTLPRKAVLMLSMDEHVKLVGADGGHLRDMYTFEFPSAQAVELLMSKKRFGRRAEAEGWPVPPTAYCETATEVEHAIADLTLPVILKPQVKNLAFRMNAPAKSFRCKDAAALRAAWDLVRQWEPEVVIQEWIPGDDSAIHFSLHYHDASLREVSSFEGRKLRQWIPECGSTSMAVGVAVPQVAELSRRILQTCGCVGFGAVEYKRDARTDRFFITEPTVGRINLQAGVAQANGVNYIARAYFHLIGRPYPEHERPRSDVKWVLARSDFKSARFYIRRGDLSWLEYLRSLRGPKEWAVWRWSDRGVVAATARAWLLAPVRLARRLLRRLG